MRNVNQGPRAVKNLFIDTAAQDVEKLQVNLPPKRIVERHEKHIMRRLRIDLQAICKSGVASLNIFVKDLLTCLTNPN